MKKTILFLFLVFLNIPFIYSQCPNVISGNGIAVYSDGSDLPASIACNSADFLMRASLNTPFGNPVVPGVIIKFTSNANASNWIQFLQNGTYWGCAGPPGNGCSIPIAPSSVDQIQVFFMSPSVSNGFIFCENNTGQPNTPFTIEDCANGAILISSTWLEDGACQTFTIPAGTISGVASWSITSVPAGTPCPGCLGLTDQGYATFKPGAIGAAGGSGLWTLCYSFDPPGACPTYTYCQNITVTNPYLAAWTAPAAMCANAGSVNLTTLLNGGSTAGGTWTGTGVTGTTFNPLGLSGTYAITYSLPCAVSVTHTITVKPVPVVTAAPPSQTFCSGGTTSVNLTSNVIGTTFTWTVVQTGVSGALPGNGSTITQTLSSTGASAGTAVYTITPTANGCSGIPLNVTITVNAPSIAPSSAAASPNTTCGGPTTLTQIGGTLGTGASYNWYTGSCGGAPAGAGASISVSPSSTTTYFVLASGTCNTTLCATVIVTVSSSSIAPSSATVSSNPICAGVSTTLTQIGGFLGAGAVYNWYTGSCGGTLIGSGASISVSPLVTTNYYVRAQGTCNITLCAQVTVTVSPVPFATATPSSQSICSGNSTSIALSSFTPGTTFSWTVIQSGVTGAASGNGASIAQTPTASGTSPGTVTYSVTPSAAGCVGNPITIVVTVNPIPTATATPALQTICSGGTSSIALTSNVSGTTFAWTVVQTGVAGASNANGSAIAETLTSTGAVIGTAVYTIIPTANGCAGAAISVTVTVSPKPAVIATPSSQTICSGTAISIALTSLVAGTTFTWTVSQTGVSGGTIGAGATIADVLTTSGSAPGTAVYTITPAANSCIGNSITVTITVNPMDAASFSYSSATFCQSGIDPAATITGLPGGVFSSTAGLVFLNASTGLIDLSASTLGTYTITYTTNGICPNTSTIVFTITGNPATGFSYTGSPFCQFGINPSPTFVSGAFAGTFSSTPAGISFVNVNTGVIDLAVSIPGTYTIKNIITGNGGCAADSATTTVIINSSPIITAGPSRQSICSGNAASIILTSSLPGTSYAWTVTELNVTGASPGIGSSISQTLTATGSSAGMAVYTITPTAGTCAGAPINDTVIVNSNTTATASAASQTFCSGGTTSIALTGSVAGTTFTWTASESGVTGAIFGSGSSIAQTLTTTGTSFGTVVYTIAPSANGCHGTDISVIVTVNPMDNASFVYPSATYCTSGTPQTPSITGLPGGVFSSIPAGLSINPSTGTITLSTSTLGAYNLSYTTSGICPNTSSITMTIANSNPSANFSYPSASYCQNGINPLPVYVSGASAGIYTSSPAGLVFIHVNTGQINLALSAPGTYTVTNTIPVSGTCLSSIATTTVTITPSDNASFTYTSATYCISGPNQLPAISGLPGGIFYASPAGLSIDSLTGTITLSTSLLGIYTVTYATNGPCPNTSSITMTIDSITPSAAFTYFGSSFCQSASNPSPIFGSGSSAGTFSSTPLGLIFVNTNTGQINLAASTPGTYTITNTIPASGTCLAATSTAAITITNLDDASFVYSSATYCLTGPNPTPAITGLPGGTFSSTPTGLSINPSTGTINLSTSSLGSYILSYTTNGPCHNTSSITMTITTNSLFAGFSFSGSSFCQNGINPLPIFVSGASAGIFSTNPIGLVYVQLNTGEIDLSSSTPGTYTVTNTIPAGGGCAAVVATTTVIITPADNASFVYSSATYCISGNPQTPVITGLPGGTFSSIPTGLSINPATGTITLSTSALGVYTLSYTTNGVCSNTSAIVMTIIDASPFANFTYSSSSFCQNAGNPFPIFGPGASAGIFSAAPGGLVFAQVNTGEIDLSLSTPGTYTVTNTIPASGTCGAVNATATVIINGSDNASFVYSSATYCLTGINQTPSITGLSGGVFSSIPPGLSINSSTGTIDLTTSSLGAYTLSYTTGGTCPNTSSIIMTITSSIVFASFSYPGSPFCQNTINPYPTYGTNASAGFFTSSPAGLVFVHVNTGQINLGASTPGTYTVTNTIPAGGGCAAVIATSTVTINPPDNASFTYTSATYCTSGSPQTPAITGLAGGTFVSIPAGLSINPSTGTITLSTSTLGAYALSYITNGTCPDTSTITMTITNTTPFANFSFSGSPFCQNSTSPYPLFGSGASAGIFTATPAGLVFVHVNTGQIDLGASAPGTYTVTNTIPVSGTCGFVSAASTVIINAAPAITATPATQNSCNGGSASIAISSSMGGTNYIWTVIQTGVSGAVGGSGAVISQALTLTGSGQGSAVYTITPNANGCTGLPIIVPITVNPLPIADTAAVIITPANCGSATGLISGVTMTSGHGPFTYQWSDSLNNTVGTNANLSNTGFGKYTLTVIDSNGCSVITGPFTVTSTPPVVAAFTLTPITGETPLTVNFTNTSSAQAINYLWHFGTGDSSNAVNPTYTYVPLGNFIVCLKADDGFGCSDTACAAVDIYVNSVFIIPTIFTPNGDGINDIFSVQGIGLKTMDAEIFNRWGQKEFEWHTTNGGWDGRTASGVIVSDGTYYFIIKATGNNEKEYLEKGSFLLMR